MFNNTPDCEKSLFMDDGLLWATGGDLQTAINKIQNSLNAIGEWGRENGIKFSTSKTKFMVFTRRKVSLIDQNGRYIGPTLYNSPIERVFQYKYLGMIFDPWLTWGPHIADLRDKCQRPLNILQTVAHRN